MSLNRSHPQPCEQTPRPRHDDHHGAQHDDQGGDDLWNGGGAERLEGPGRECPATPTGSPRTPRSGTRPDPRSAIGEGLRLGMVHGRIPPRRTGAAPRGDVARIVTSSLPAGLPGVCGPQVSSSELLQLGTLQELVREQLLLVEVARSARSASRPSRARSPEAVHRGRGRALGREPPARDAELDVVSRAPGMVGRSGSLG